MRLSRGFLLALAGLAMTAFSWYSPWTWPAWPALTLLGILFPRGGFGELSSNARAAVMVGLIVWNSGVWALVFYSLSSLVRRIASADRVKPDAAPRHP